MEELTIIPVTKLQAFSAGKVQKRIDGYIYKMYKYILKQADKGEYEYECWFDTDDNGNMSEEHTIAVNRIKELFPGIVYTVKLANSKEIHTMFSWHPTN
jgi:hypothetical protein